MAFGKKKPQVDPVAIAQAQRARKRQEVSEAFPKGHHRTPRLYRAEQHRVSSTYFQLGTRFARTYYVYGYPRQVYTGWLSSMVNLDEVIDMSIYVYPVESQVVLENLRKKVLSSRPVSRSTPKRAASATRENRLPS